MIFVDTSAWLALADSRDRDHSEALDVGRRLARGEFGKQITTNYILAETISLIRRQLGVPTAASLAEAIASSGEIRTFWIEPVHHEQAVRLMAAHPDKSWSLADCSSFVIMRALDISKAFTFDSDFAQAGFQPFPEP
ncbi:MAG: PIN domain-containing protein [Thermoplasmata archaeon]|nr:PIN domain-containing protein [Thermoplasmata archaeon]